jgi:hypothetical protein
MLIHSHGGETGSEDLPPAVVERWAEEPGATASERKRLISALTSTNWNRSRAADKLRWLPKKIFSGKKQSALNWQIRQQRNSASGTDSSKAGVIGSSVRYRSTPHHRSRLANRVRPRHRRPHPRHQPREDLAQEALLAALEQWPRTGVPENPGAWLTATAKRRAIDMFRRNAVPSW